MDTDVSDPIQTFLHISFDTLFKMVSDIQSALRMYEMSWIAGLVFMFIIKC